MQDWTEVITYVCNALEEAAIAYHADASSSLFVHGFEFAMDDFDVTVEWGKIELAKALFVGFEPSIIDGDSPQQFQFVLDGFNIDVMSYPSASGIGPKSQRYQVEFAGTMIWTKRPEFYLQRMRSDHPIREAALKFFNYSI